MGAAVTLQAPVSCNDMRRITTTKQLKELSNRVVAYSAPLFSEGFTGPNEYAPFGVNFKLGEMNFAWIRPERHAITPVLDGKMMATKYKMYPLLSRILPDGLTCATTLEVDKLEKNPLFVRELTEAEESALKLVVYTKNAHFNALSLLGFNEYELPPGFYELSPKSTLFFVESASQS